MENQSYRLCPGVVKTDIGHMALVYSPKSEKFLVLNETAGKLLSLLEQGQTSVNMLKGLDTLYSNSIDGTHKDYVKLFLHSAINNQIIEVFDGQPKPFSKINLPRVYEKISRPVFSVFEKKWILENHPDAIYDAAFSDTWSPASQHP